VIARKKPSRQPKRAKNGHGVTVLLEDIRAQVSAVAEGVLALKESTDRQFESIERRFESVDQRFDRVDRELAGLRQDGRELASIVARKADAAALAALDQRVTALEQRARA
jgi:hypothetical protein